MPAPGDWGTGPGYGRKKKEVCHHLVSLVSQQSQQSHPFIISPTAPRSHLAFFLGFPSQLSHTPFSPGSFKGFSPGSRLALPSTRTQAYSTQSLVTSSSTPEAVPETTPGPTTKPIISDSWKEKARLEHIGRRPPAPDNSFITSTALRFIYRLSTVTEVFRASGHYGPRSVSPSSSLDIPRSDRAYLALHTIRQRRPLPCIIASASHQSRTRCASPCRPTTFPTCESLLRSAELGFNFGLIAGALAREARRRCSRASCIYLYRCSGLGC